MQRVLSELSVSTVEFTPLGSHECSFISEPNDSEQLDVKHNAYLHALRLRIGSIRLSIDRAQYFLQDEAGSFVILRHLVRTGYEWRKPGSDFTISEYHDVG